MFGCMVCVAANDLSLSYVAYLNAEQMVRVKFDVWLDDLFCSE